MAMRRTGSFLLLGGRSIPKKTGETSSRRPFSTVVSNLAAGAACALGTCLAGLYFGQRRLIWMGQRSNGAAFEAADPSRVPDHVRAEIVRGRAPESTVGCLYTPTRGTSSKKTLVYFHGNGDQIGWGGTPINISRLIVLPPWLFTPHLLLLFHFFLWGGAGAYLAPHFTNRGLSFFAVEYPGSVH